MNINILTIFPEIFNVLNSGVVSKPIKNKTLKLNTYDIRKNAVNKHNHVDAKPYGGGEGMVIMAEPVVKSLNQIAKSKLGKVIYLTPQGKKLNQKKVLNLSKLKNITLICGRYEGIDQRIIDKYVDEVKTYTNLMLYISSENLPSLNSDEVYWHDLVGMLVIDENKNELLGEVKDINNFGANECLIVHATDDSIDNKERLIPFIRNNFISQIDKEKRIITVNWQSDY